MKQNLDRSEWANYFEEFNRRNLARPTLLEVFGENGAQEEEHGLPFAGISVARGNDTPEIEIMFGSQQTAHSSRLTHSIRNVQQITSKLGPDGRDEALEIVADHGEISLLRFGTRPMIASGD
jgi:hypothetical protein